MSVWDAADTGLNRFDAWMKVYDKDQDGKISIEEFYNFFKDLYTQRYLFLLI